MINVARLVFFAFSALLVVGGVLGYVEAKSVISLVAGLVCGALSLAAALLLPGKPVLGLALGIAAALLAGGGMAPRFFQSPKLWPGGVTLAFSVVTLIVAVVALTQARGAGTVRATGGDATR